MRYPGPFWDPLVYSLVCGVTNIPSEELAVSPEDTEKADMRIVQAAAEEVCSVKA